MRTIGALRQALAKAGFFIYLLDLIVIALGVATGQKKLLLAGVAILLIVLTALGVRILRAVGKPRVQQVAGAPKPTSKRSGTKGPRAERASDI